MVDKTALLINMHRRSLATTMVATLVEGVFILNQRHSTRQLRDNRSQRTRNKIVNEDRNEKMKILRTK